jgi:hypothetical protein
MKKLIAITVLLLALFASTAQAQEQVISIGGRTVFAALMAI